MKKLLLLCLAFVMIVSVIIPVSATTGAFVDSPSLNPAPELVKGENENEECEATIVVTAYGDRDKLAEADRKSIEEAYTIIRGTKDLSTLNEMIAEIAKELGVEVTDLAVSDLFDISDTECTLNHEDHGYFDITLKSNTLENFVCLLHYYNGEWRIVENAIVTNNGEHLEFEEKEFSPFAIVVYTGDADITVPVQQDNGDPTVAIVVSALAAVGASAISIFLVLFYKRRKKK